MQTIKMPLICSLPAIMSDSAQRPVQPQRMQSLPPALPTQLRMVDANRLLADLCDIADIAVVHASLDGQIIYANDAFLALNSLCGGGNEMVRLPGFMDDLRQMRLSAARQVSQQVIETRDGLCRCWVNIMPVVDDMGALTGVAALYQNWTQELVQVDAAVYEQARYQDFARAAADFFWETDAQNHLTHVSEGLVALLEQHGSAFIGKPLESLGRLQVNSNGEQPFARSQAIRTAFRHQLLSMTLPSGENRLFHLSAVPVMDADGRFGGYRGAAMDVTRAYRLEDEARRNRNSLESALSELQRNNIVLDMASSQTQSALSAKNEFLAAMSHELRTPLNAIIGFAEAMELQVFGELGPRYIAYAHDIRGAGQHLLGLINDVLDVSVIESGEIQMSREPLSVARIMDAARSLISLRAAAKSIDVSATHIAHDRQIFADERRTLQIFVNLLTNAVKFTPEGGRIGADVTAAPHGQIAITLWDSGPGIAAADQERVFEKFQQLVTETYRGKPEGTGLGLHISRELARLMSGDIRLKTMPGQGAHFILTLPAA
jgi:signal transduction histidine kinase